MSEASRRFQTAITHCHNLVDVHRAHGGVLQGRRDQEVSINRAIIVVTVAAWQAAVQDMTLAAIIAGQPDSSSPVSSQTYAVVIGRVKKDIGDFSTPNAENVRRLLLGVGFDPRPYWTWSQRGGQGVGMVQLQPIDIDKKIGDWLRLRHDIAHGHDQITHVDVLQAVRQKQNPAPEWSPTIRLVDAEACMTFFRRLCKLTANGLGEHLRQKPGDWSV